MTIELKTGKIHSDVEAVKPREPFLRGRIAPNNRFYVSSKELKKWVYLEESEEWAASLSYVYYPQKVFLMRPQKVVIVGENSVPILPKIVPQFLPKNWTVTESGEDSIEITSPDNRAIVTVNKNVDFIETDVVQFAKRMEKETLRSFNAYRQLSLQPAQVFGNKQGYLRRFQWHNKEIAEDVILIQVYYVEHSYKFTATAAARASNFEKFKVQLQQIFDNLRIEYKD